MKTVYVLRGGAPDKINLTNTRYVKYIKENNINFYNKPMFTSMLIMEAEENSRCFILPADERDIEILQGKSLDYVLLPKCNGKIIDYSLVAKNSSVYSEFTAWMENNGYPMIKYPNFVDYTPDEFKKSYKKSFFGFTKKEIKDKVVKLTYGSGSRGVWVSDTKKNLPGVKQDKLTSKDIESIYESACNNKANIIVQDLARNVKFANGTIANIKINVDFIIKNKKLLGYKWEYPEEEFTNWNRSLLMNNKYTEKLMKGMCKYLIKKVGITDAIMNFEAFVDDINEPSCLSLVEFNFRYSNSMFETRAFGVDMVDCYLYNKPFTTPDKESLVRAWTPVLVKDLTNFHDNQETQC